MHPVAAQNARQIVECDAVSLVEERQLIELVLYIVEVLAHAPHERRGDTFVNGDSQSLRLQGYPAPDLSGSF